MAEETRVSAAVLVDLARVTLDASTGLRDALVDGQYPTALPPAVFGNVPVGEELHLVHQAAVEDVQHAVDVVGAVYEHEVELLYQAAVTFRATDEDVAHELRGSTTTGTLPGRR